MKYKYKEGERVLVNVNENARGTEPEWVEAEIEGMVEYHTVPAYRFTKEVKSGYGRIFLEAHVKPLGGNNG